MNQVHWTEPEQALMRNTDALKRANIIEAVRAYMRGYYPLLPTPEERQRQIFEHQWLTQATKLLQYAPLHQYTSLRSALDIGCGAASWCQDLAREYPHTQVYGLDMHDYVQGTLPKNCYIHQGDVLNPWLYQSQTMDYVHMRGLGLGLGITTQALKHITEEAHRVLVRGGWIEVMETAYEIQAKRPMPATEALMVMLKETMSKVCINLRVLRHYDQYLVASGFEGVQRIEVDLPLYGEAHKANLGRENILQFFRHLWPFLKAQGGAIDIDTYAHLLTKAEQEWQQEKAKIRYYCYFAGKPRWS